MSGGWNDKVSVEGVEDLISEVMTAGEEEDPLETSPPFINFLCLSCLLRWLAWGNGSP